MWKAISEAPALERGESAEFWVAILFEGRDHSKPRASPEAYKPAKQLVIKLSYINASLTQEEADYWGENDCLPEGSPSILENWQNDDGEHSDFSGWAAESGEYFQRIIPDENGIVPDGYMVGRFKLVAHQQILKPEYPCVLAD